MITLMKLLLFPIGFAIGWYSVEIIGFVLEFRSALRKRKGGHA